MRAGLAAALAVAAAGIAVADEPCRVLEVQLKPVAHLQMAVWIEDEHGGYVDTAYVTRSTGALGLGNRPGSARFKSNYRWPYGRRVMVMPVWAHTRNHQYGYVVMGGAAGFDPHDDSIGFHEANSSTENFYCGPIPSPKLMLDATSCATPFTGSKGRYLPGQTSLYPPRADLTQFGLDSDDARRFAKDNDLAAISGATPPGSQLMSPIIWAVPDKVASGNYVVKVEASLEGDFNDANPAGQKRSVDDFNASLNTFGVEVFGQGSVVYAVPIRVDGTPRTAVSDDWIGYGDWDGATGTLHPKDASISDGDGSGAGRLLHVVDGDGTWRVKAYAAGCQACSRPQAPGALSVNPGANTLALSFAAPASTDDRDRARRYEIRYRPRTPLDDASFGEGIPADGPPPLAPGATQTAMLDGLKPDTVYYVGVRALNVCGQPGPAAFVSTRTTLQQFTTLHGCFIATAAYGSPLAGEIDVLRRLRDRALLTSPLGRLAVGAYYALSPPVAAAIAGDERLRAGARALLAPVVAVARALEHARGR